MSFNIAVAGKSGAGKTSVAGLVIRYLMKNGSGPILAIAADPNANLGESLGLKVEQTVGLVLDLPDTSKAVRAASDLMAKLFETEEIHMKWG